MTVISIIERRAVPPQPQCERCDRIAWVQTSVGPRCEDHSLDDLRQAIGGGDTRIPRFVRNRRAGSHAR